MDISQTLSATELAYYIAATFCFVFATIVAIKKNHLSSIGKTFCVAAYVNALWLASLAFFDPFQFSSAPDDNLRTHAASAPVLFMETLHYCFWILALIRTIQATRPDFIQRKLRVIVYSIGITLPPLSLFFLSNDIIEQNSFKILAWHGIIFSVLNLLIIEQLYRSALHDRLIRLFCVSLGLNFLFDAVLFSQNIIALEQDEILWQIRASFSIVTYAFMTIGLVTFQGEPKNQAKISFSQPAVFYSATLTISGLALIALAVGGYYIRLKSTSWLTITYSTLTIAAIVLIALTLTSTQIRQKLNVFINKHLFNYKYDYRSEWLKLISGLSQPMEHDEFALKAIQVTANLFRCDGAALARLQNNHYILTEHYGEFDPSLRISETADSPFSEFLLQDWIFAPGSLNDSLAKHNESLPEWAHQIKDPWLIAPLFIEEEIIGFIILSHPKDGEQPNWEDLSLAKTVGRQIANYLTRHAQTELLAQARQFETFNKLSAFVMHDLKNLIAQQSLVVKNAEKHKDNPAFVEDAINTIKNSVDRMNNLLQKLRQNAPEETKVISLKELLLEATKRCLKSSPSPTLMQVDESLHVKADFDSLTMVFTHLIHNAQDATPSNGFIDIHTSLANKQAIICIEDNGEGMTDEFIRTKLFQPFESTKAGKGMGVGVYQAREYIESLGGCIDVESTVGQGSKFSLTIPVVEA